MTQRRLGWNNLYITANLGPVMTKHGSGDLMWGAETLLIFMGKPLKLGSHRYLYPASQSASILVLTYTECQAILVCFWSHSAELVARGVTLPASCHSSVSSLCLHPQHPRWWLSGVNVCFVPISFLCQTCQWLNRRPEDKNNTHLLASDFRLQPHSVITLWWWWSTLSSISESRSDFLGR